MKINFNSVKHYANSLFKKQKPSGVEPINYSKLEGLQSGIDVFNGLSMKELILLENKLSQILLKRGCSNGCVHCFCSAVPQPLVKQSPDKISTMSWEDFSSITEGFKELEKRLGNSTSIDFHKYPILPFSDADAMEITLKDSNNLQYDMLDIAKKVRDDMGRKTLFDTAGWSPNFAKMQARAEKYVKTYLSDLKSGNTNFFSFNVSLNPFHSLLAKSAELFDVNPEKSKKFRDLYTTRMANVFFTTTPLLKFPEFRLLNRAFPDDASCKEFFKHSYHLGLIGEIGSKLQNLYKQSGMPLNEIRENMDIFYARTNSVNTEKLGIIGRAKNLFAENSVEFISADDIIAKNKSNPADILNKKSSRLIVDCNGKIYAADDYSIVKTNMSLNISSKDKDTAPHEGLIDGVLTVDDVL